MVGREVSQLYPARESTPGKVMLSLRKVGCAFTGIHDLNLEIRSGEIVGLAGLVGAGRTELARTVFGITPLDTGEMIFDGSPVNIQSPQKAIAKGIAYVPEDRRRHGVVVEMSIAENISMALHQRLFPKLWLRFMPERQLACRYIQDLAIKTPSPAEPVSSLSGGNQQKVSIGRWLATEPKLLILDEPTQGVDIGAKGEIHKIIRELAKRGVAVLLISSDLPEVLGMSDRVGVMRNGTIVASFPAGSKEDHIMSAAFGGEQNSIGAQHPKTGYAPTEQSDGDKPPTLGAGAERRTRSRKFPLVQSRELSVGAVLAFILIMLGLFAPSFYERQPLLSLAAREAPTLLVACGMALVIICRQIDISVGSQFALCSVCAGLLATTQCPLSVVLLASLGLGLTLGAMNGLLIAGLRLPSIVVTLATMVTWREALRWKRQGQFVNLPDGIQWLGLQQIHGQFTVIAFALMVLVLLAWATKHLATGRFVYAVGSDPQAARLAGIRPQWMTFAVFCGMGSLTGLAAVLNLIQSPQVDPKSGTGLELKSIAAVVVGGVAISGGRGNLWGVFLGLLLLSTVSPALTHLQLPPYWERAIQGAIILIAVLADGRRTKKQRL
jgi:ribose/xylose/arabinose/galactoside ABC-type transport system permease subunit/ABC-type multidrug transport system ATPase subunit